MTVKLSITMSASHVLARHQNCLLENPMLRSLKPLPLTLAIAALCLITTGCGSSSTQVRVINAMYNTNGPGVNVEFNSAQTFTTAIQFGSILPAISSPPAATYTSVPSGTDTIQVFNAGSTTDPIVTNNLPLDSGEQYTLVLAPDIVTPFVDDNTAPASGSDLVEVRVIDASTAGPLVDVYLIPCGENISSTYKIGTIIYPNYINYDSVAFNSNSCPGGSDNYEFEVFEENSTANPFVNQYYNLSVGSITTLVLLDNVQGDQLSGLQPSPIPLVLYDLD